MERHASLFFFSLSFFLLLFLSSSFQASAAAQLNSAQSQIVKNLFETLQSGLSFSNADLNTTNPNPCKWSGVTCASRASSVLVVEQLSFSNLGISSSNSSSLITFFKLLCEIDTLQYLNLSSNRLSSLPDLFSSNCTGLAGLKSLNLSNNGLAGPFSDFSNFRDLETLDLSHNHLVGTIGTKLDSLTQLKSLDLSFNCLTGTVPALNGSSNSIHLEKLTLTTNNFTGMIPVGIFAHKNLTLLDLSQNNLTGTILDQFKDLPKLEILLLNANSLTGHIPASLTKLTNLTRFAAYQNKFDGPIPNGLTKYLQTLDLSYNNLIGTIPFDFLNSSNLESIDLTNNSLTGPIPINLSRKIYRLRFGENFLNGTIPKSIGELSNLSYLELDGNKLDGEIPSQIGNCTNLTLLNLALNKFENKIPSELGKLTNLVVLKLQENNLSGQIPPEISNFLNLNTLNLSQNSLTGPIPSQISKLTELSNLNLNQNNLNGSIPSTIQNLTSLIELQLGNNRLSGVIPEMPSSLTTALNLSHNLFTGNIPASSFSQSTELEILDLSHNNFSGSVPVSLSSLQSLTLLNLSYNNLSGTLPNFRSWVDVVIYGNTLLTIPNDKPQNNPPNNTKTKSHKGLIIAIVIIGSLIGLACLTGLIILSVSNRFYRVENVSTHSDENTPPNIINGRLITTNRIHTSSIDFPKSMESISNPLNIFMKTRFCTYYKVIMPNGSTYSVKKLNWSDKLFQIENRDKFSHELDLLGKLTNSNVMVPLAYVLTEQNAYLFYENLCMGTVFDALHGNEVLDWTCRYGVALGVAQGLAFLHGCTNPVLLLDLSTRTVFLKSFHEPQIGDIELYKVIDPSNSTSSFSTVAGTVGYIPPEYAYTMRITTAGNVYSFGVILLELLTGKPPVSEGIELAKWALSNSSRAEERDGILDSRISRASISVHSQMQSVLKVALACVAFSPDSRPKMRNVLRMLFSAK
ncbi:hypothetical protein LUZ60_007708 [Juncus effusus]|nr:hypothetical protein LUZ60_007708 [Juncus effusus]